MSKFNRSPYMQSNPQVIVEVSHGFSLPKKATNSKEANHASQETSRVVGEELERTENKAQNES